MNVDVEFLRTFVAAADSLHFARAAEILHLDPSGVSRHVRSLESKLQVALFIRSTRRVELTDAGRTLLPIAREVVDAHDRFRAAAKSAARTAVGVLRFGLQTHSVTPDTVDTIYALARDAGIERVELVEANFTDTSAGLRSGATDVALVFTPLDDRGLRLVPTLDISRVAVVRDDHRLAGQTEVSLADIADEPWLIPSTDDSVFFDFWMATHERGADHPLIVGGQCRTPEEGLMAAKAGAGIAVGATARGGLQPNGLVVLPIIDLAPCGVAVAVRSDADARTTAFADQLAGHLAS